MKTKCQCNCNFSCAAGRDIYTAVITLNPNTKHKIIYVDDTNGCFSHHEALDYFLGTAVLRATKHFNIIITGRCDDPKCGDRGSAAEMRCTLYNADPDEPPVFEKFEHEHLSEMARHGRRYD
jgi:hypothetical protein